MGELDETARKRVRAWLDSTGETQTAFGDRISRNQAWMSRYLDAEFDADLDTLKQLAAAMQMSLWQLLDVETGNQDEAELLRAFRALRPKRRNLALELVRDWQEKRSRK